MSLKANVDADSLELILVLIRGLKRNGFNDEDIRFKLRKRFEEHEVTQALEVFAHQALPDQVDAPQALKEPSTYFGWYQGPKEGPEFHWPRLKEALKHKDSPWTDEMIGNLDESSTLVLSLLAPPESEKSICTKGLVLGYIQSGKTANFSATIAKAIDEGYKLIIVLAGMHNNLRKQTEIRLREELVQPASGKTCTTLTTDEDTGDFKRRQSITATRTLVRKDGFTLAVIKKNSSVLRNFREWLEEAEPGTLKGCPTLIIDDESDQASINTNREDQDPTAINNHIREMVKLFNVVSYVGYTATPFANVFINADVNDNLYPRDFLIALDKPATYYGPEELFGRDSVNGRSATSGLPVIRVVPDKDALLIRERIDNETEETMITDSLIEAIDAFVLAGGLRLCRGHWKQHITMLLHLSHLVGPQQRMMVQVQDYIEELRRNLEDRVPEVCQRLLKIHEMDFKKVSHHLEVNELPDERLLLTNITKFVERLEVILDNSKSSERLTFDRSERDGDPVWGIVIGGNTLSRGLTLEGLTTSYFTRSSKAYDTLLQMGRWFGYRKGYVDLTRIYVTSELHSHFHHLATVEQEIRDEVRVMSINNERPIDVALRIRRHPNMTATSSNKMRNSINASLTYSGTKVQTFQINVSNLKSIDKNQKLVSEFIDRIQSKIYLGPKFKDFEHAPLYRNLSGELIQQFLDGLVVSESNLKFDKRLIQGYITEMLKKGELNDWSVVISSKRDGKPVEIGPNSIMPVTRMVRQYTRLDNGEYEAILRAVSTPGDELIDLADLAPNASTTQELLSKSKSDTRIRFEIRPKSRGLLLIYPLETEFKDESFALPARSPEATTMPLLARGQMYAFSLVFPRAEAPIGQLRYIKNSTV